MSDVMPERVSIGVRSGSFTSDAVSTQMFGGNFLMGKDSTSGTFGELVRTFGMTNLRYPGGGIAEDYFDVNNPDNVPPSLTGTLDTLSSFLAFCAAHDVAPVIVLPTKRYMADMEAGIAEIVRFVERVTSGEFGDVKIAAFEIGNEFYATSNNHGPMSGADYGALASRMAEAVAEAAAYPVDISVQMGRDPVTNAAIMASFDTAAEREAVTSLTYHDYPWLESNVADRIAARMAIAEQWKEIGVDADLYLSEWNVGSSPEETPGVVRDYGMRQLPALLQIFEESCESGVDRASIWGIQQRTKTALAGIEGSGRVWAAGHLFRMMAESLPGTKVIATDEAAARAQGVDVFAFESDKELVLFVSAGDVDEAAGGSRVVIDLGKVPAHFGLVWTETLSAIGDPLAERPPVSVSIGHSLIQYDAEGNASLRVDLESDFDLVRLVLPKTLDAGAETGSISRGENGSLIGGAGDDTIAGGSTRDMVYGFEGQDRISGGSGNDSLVGGDGYDRVFGGAGSDRIMGGGAMDYVSGGEGSDFLYGGMSDDRLDGNAGADRIFGDAGVDLIDGSAGNDLLTGGSGADFFRFGTGHGSDRILDFQNGQDVIDLSGIASITSFADLEGRITLVRGSAVIDTGEGTIRLVDIPRWMVGEADFIFG